MSASAPGLTDGTIDVYLSNSPEVDGAMAVASSSAKLPLEYPYLTNFRG